MPLQFVTESLKQFGNPLICRQAQAAFRRDLDEVSIEPAK
jgi:hypothetical protein